MTSESTIEREFGALEIVVNNNRVMIQEHTYHGLIAACGMNCGLCIGYLREKNPCGGCFKKDDLNKPNSCRSCVIVNCESLTKTESGFCYECNNFPC